jgi:hypothetical protein
MPQARNLSSRLDAFRRESFIGREELLAGFDRSLQGGERRVFLVHGRSGFGKTMLLHEFARRAREAGRIVVELDGGSEDRMREQLRRRLVRLDARAAPGSPGAHLASAENTPVVLIDDADQVERVMRTELLPGLPASILIVMATSAPPSSDWDIDPGWRSLVHVAPLPGFSRDEAIELLARLGITGADQERLWHLADGHPLTLSLVARHWPARGFAYLAVPELVDSFLDRLVGPLTEPGRSDALFVCAHASRISEDLLSYVLRGSDVSAVWEWLCSLGVVWRTPTGVGMIELVRQLVEAQMKHRSPDRWFALHAATHEFARSRIVELNRSPGECLGPVKNLFSGHETSALSRLWECQESIRLWPRGAFPADHQRAVELIRYSGGESEGALARYWLTRQPQSLYVGDLDGEVVTTAMNLELGQADAVDCPDPVVAAILRGLEDEGLMRTGDTVQLLRFVADDAGLRDSTPATYLGVLSAVANWLSAGSSLAVAAGPFGRRWQQVLADLALTPLHLEGEAPGLVYYFDFRRFPPCEWFRFLVRHGLRGANGLPQDKMRPAPLTYIQFAQAVQDALRDLHHPDKLADNPLARAPLIEQGDQRPGEALQQRLVAAARSIGTSEKERALARVLEISYIQVATSQKAAARLLDLPFSTYRRYLARGVQRLVDLLWAVEVRNVQMESSSGAGMRLVSGN